MMIWNLFVKLPWSGKEKYEKSLTEWAGKIISGASTVSDAAGALTASD